MPPAPANTGYYPGAPQPQYGPPAPGPGLSGFPGQVLGLVMVIAGGVLALLGLILALSADFGSYSAKGYKPLWVGCAFLVGGIVMLGQWLAAAITAKK